MARIGKAHQEDAAVDADVSEGRLVLADGFAKWSATTGDAVCYDAGTPVDDLPDWVQNLVRQNPVATRLETADNSTGDEG